MTSLNRLRHRITIELPQRSSDGAGGATITWQPLSEAWADIRPRNGNETVFAGGLTSQVSHDITIRYRTDVSADARLRLGSRVFDILSAINRDECGIWLDCRCRERPAE